MSRPGIVVSIVVSIVVVCLLSGGCAYGELKHVVRAQFASDYDCPEVKMEKRMLWYARDGSEQFFKVSGCGHLRSYTCPEDPGLVSYDDEEICTYVEGDIDAPKIETQDQEPPADDFADDSEMMDEPEPAVEDVEEPDPAAEPVEDEPSDVFGSDDDDDGDVEDDLDDL